MSVWMDQVREKTNGKVDFDVHYNGTLIPAAESLSGLQAGVADIGFVAVFQNPEQFPLGDWNAKLDEVLVPRGYPEAALVGSAAGMVRSETGPARDELSKLGIEPLLSAVVTHQPTICTKPVSSLTDASGVLVRTGGQPWAGEGEALGMTNVTVPFTEVYEAMQRGVVECVNTGPVVFTSTGVMEVANNVSLIDSGFSSGAQMAFNKDSWDSLPLVVQQIMHDAKPAMYTEYLRATFEAFAEFIKMAEDLDYTFNDTTELDAKLASYRESLLEGVASAAPPGVDDADEYIAAYTKQLEGWTDVVTGVIDPVEGDAREQLLSGADAVDWDMYESAIAKSLAEIRPR